ncbi:MAG: hypothetical protein M3P04_02520 [Actinomycetota bacterium]|nr:hypothetical protein [Actinomycetota bacterium]
MKAQQEQCPKCGRSGVPILYGMPDGDVMEAVREGQLVLGGCCVSDEDPVLACPACDERWGRRLARLS